MILIHATLEHKLMRTTRFMSAVFVSLLLMTCLFLFSQKNALAATPLSPDAGAPSTSKDLGIYLEDDEDAISLDLKGVDVLDLFRILSLRTDTNITASKNVTGRVNLFLNSVSFDEAFEVIMVSQGLAYERMGNIIYVMTATEYEALYGIRYTDRREIYMKKIDSMDPKRVLDTFTQIKSEVGKLILDEKSGTLIIIDVPEKIDMMEDSYALMQKSIDTKLFNLKYADAEELKDQLTEALIPGTSEIYVDPRTNKIAVTDLEGNMPYVEALVEAFDERKPEVLIDARIMEVTLTSDYRLGVDWERIANKINGRSIDFSSNFPLTGTVPAQIGTVTIGNLASDDFSVAIQMVESVGRADILSNPRIAVVSGEEAKILVGSREVFITQTLSQGEASTTTSESIEFVEVGVKLSVKPIVHRGGLVTITMKPEVSSVRTTVTSALGSVVPVIDTSEAETTVSIKNGHSVIVGGLVQRNDSQTDEQVPFLGRIPVLGRIFKATTKDNTKKEIVLFLSPKIISGTSNVSLVDGVLTAKSQNGKTEEVTIGQSAPATTKSRKARLGSTVL